MAKFEASFTYKMIVFQFINYYGPMVYIGLLKGQFVTKPVIHHDLITAEHCEPSGCMSELAVQLVIIMIVKQIVQGILEIALPIFEKFRKSKEFFWKVSYIFR